MRTQQSFPLFTGNQISLRISPLFLFFICCLKTRGGLSIPIIFEENLKGHILKHFGSLSQVSLKERVYK